MATLTIPPKRSSGPLASMTGHHAALRVPDLETSKRWFVEKLDFRVVHEWPYGDLQLAFVAPPADDTFFVEILGGAAPTPRPDYSGFADSFAHAGLHHFCLSVEDVDATITELDRRGVTVVAEPFDLEDIGHRLAFIADPWGNLIEFAQVLQR